MSDSPRHDTPVEQPTRDTQRSEHPAIEADDLRLTYADGTEAVRGLSIDIERGEFFGFLGPNGAGKTTTIKILATLLEPTGGSVRINGYDIGDSRTAVRGTIGYMPQETSIDEELTARENLQFSCGAYGVSRSDRNARIEELLELVDLVEVADTPAGQFSGGMKKRLDAATALVHDPELVFLDEPTTGLDPKARNRLWDYFGRINEAGTTVFLTTQYLEEADALCDRLSVIRDGRIVADGSPEELKRRVGEESLELELDDQSTLSHAATLVRDRDMLGSAATVETTGDGIRITAREASQYGTDLLVSLQDAGITVTSFDITEPTLDDVFLAIADDTAGDLGEQP